MIHNGYMKISTPQSAKAINEAQEKEVSFKVARHKIDRKIKILRVLS